MVDLQLDLSITCDDGIPVEMCVTDNITAREIIQLVIASRKAMCPALTINVDDCALSIDAGGIARILCLDSRVDLSSSTIRDVDYKAGQPAIINVFGFRARAAESLKSQNRDDYLIRKAALELRYLIQSSTAYRKSANESSCVTLSNNSYDNREFSVMNAERVLTQILSRESLFSTRATSSTNTDHSTCASVNDPKGKIDTKSNSQETHGNNEKSASNTGHQPSLEESVHEQYIDFTYNVKGVLHDSGLHDTGPGRELVNKADIFLYIGDVYGLVNALSNYEQGHQQDQSSENVQRAGSPKHSTNQDRSIGSASIDSDRGRKRRFEEAANQFRVINSHLPEPGSVPASMGYRPCQYDDFSTQSSTGELFSATADDNVTSPPVVALQNDKGLPLLSYHTVAADEQKKYRNNRSNSSSSSSRDRGKHLSSRQRGAIASGDDTDDDHMKSQMLDDSFGPRLHSQLSPFNSLHSHSQSQPVNSTVEVEVEVEVEHDEQLFDTRRTDTAIRTASAPASDLLLHAGANQIIRVNAENININIPQCAKIVTVTSTDRNLPSAAAVPCNNASIISHKECSSATIASGSPAAALHPIVQPSQPLRVTAAVRAAGATTSEIATAAAASLISRDDTHGLELSIAPHHAGKKSSRVTYSTGCIGIELIVAAGGSNITKTLHDEEKNDNKCDLNEDRRMIKHAVDSEANHISSSCEDGHVAVGKAKQEHQGSDMTPLQEIESPPDIECAERAVTGKQLIGPVQMDTDRDEDNGPDFLEGLKVDVKIGDMRGAETEQGNNTMDVSVNTGDSVHMIQEDLEEILGAGVGDNLGVSASFKMEEELIACSDEYRAGEVPMLDAAAASAAGAAVVVVATTAATAKAVAVAVAAAAANGVVVVRHNEAESGLEVMTGDDEVEREEVLIQSAGSEAISPKGSGLLAGTAHGDKRETGACVTEEQSERDEMTGQGVRGGEKTEAEGVAMKKDDSMAKRREVLGSEEGQVPAAEDTDIDALIRSTTDSAHGLEGDVAAECIKQALMRGGVTSSNLITGDELKSDAEEDKVEDGLDLNATGSDEKRRKEKSRADHEVSSSAAAGAKNGSEDGLVEEEGITRDEEDQNVLEGEEDSDQDDISFLPFQIDRTLLLTQSHSLERGESQETFYEKSSCDVLYGDQNSILDPIPSSTNRYDVSGYDDDDDDDADDGENDGSEFHTVDDDEAHESTDSPSKNLITSAVPSPSTTGDSSDGILYGQPLTSSPPSSSSPMEEQGGGQTAAQAASDNEQSVKLNEVQKGGTRVQVAVEVNVSDLALEEVTAVHQLGVRAEGQQSNGGQGQEDSDSALAGMSSKDTTVGPVKASRDLAHRKVAKAGDQYKVNVKAALGNLRTRARTRSSQATEQDPLRSQMAEQLAEQMRYLEARRAALDLAEADSCMDAVSSTDPSSSSDEESDNSVVVIEGAGVSGTACDHFEQLGSQATASASSGCAAENENVDSEDSLRGAREKVREEAPADVLQTQDDSPISDEQPRRKRGRPPKRAKEHWRNRYEATQATRLKKKFTPTDQSQSSSGCDDESDGADSGSGVHHKSQKRHHDHVVEVRAGISARGREKDLTNMDVSPDRSTALDRAGEDHSNSVEPDMSPVIYSKASQSSMKSGTRDPGSHIPLVPTADVVHGSPMLHRMSTRTVVRTESSAPAPAVVAAVVLSRGASSAGKISHEIAKRRDEKKVKDGIRAEQASTIGGVLHLSEEEDEDGEEEEEEEEEEGGGVHEDMTTSVEGVDSHDNVNDESSAGDDGDGDYMDDDVEFQAEEEIMPGNSRRIPKNKSAPKISKDKIKMTAKSKSKSKSSNNISRDVAIVRRNSRKGVPSRHVFNSVSCSSDGEEPELEAGTEEDLTGADSASMGVGGGVGMRVRKSSERNTPAKVLTTKIKDGIRKRSLLGQMESFVKRESILANIFSDSDSKSEGGSDGDARAKGLVKGSKASIGVNKINSDKNNNLDGRARSESDDSDDRERESSVEVDKTVRRDGRHQSDRTSTSTSRGGHDHDSELSDASVGGREAGERGRLVTSVPSQSSLKRSSSHSSTDKGPTHRPHSSGSTSSSSTSSSPSYLSPHGPANRKTPIDYLQDAIPPNSASPIPSISNNFKKFDNPLMAVDTSRRDSISRKIPLQAIQSKQSFSLSGAFTGKAQAQGRILGSQPQPQPRSTPSSNDREAHPSLESLLNKSKSPTIEKSSPNRYDALRMSRVIRKEKKLRRQQRMKERKRVNDPAIEARSPTEDSTASDSSGSPGSPDIRKAVKGAESVARRGSPVKRRKGEDYEASGTSLEGVEESEEQKRLRRVAACELLLLNRRSSSAPVENTTAVVKVKQRVEKRKDREGDGKFTQEVKKKGRPLGSTSIKQTEVRQERKSPPSSPHSTRQSTGGKEPRHSTGGEGEALRRLSQASDFRNKTVPRGYGAGISLSSLSATDLGTQPRKGNGISLSALTLGGKIRPVTAVTTFNSNTSDDRGNFTSTKQMRGSSSSSSSSSSNIYSKRYNDNDRSRTSNNDDSRLKKDRDRDRDRGTVSAGSSRSLGKGAHSSISESVLV